MDEVHAGRYRGRGVIQRGVLFGNSGARGSLVNEARLDLVNKSQRSLSLSLAHVRFKHKFRDLAIYF